MARRRGPGGERSKLRWYVSAYLPTCLKIAMITKVTRPTRVQYQLGGADSEIHSWLSHVTKSNIPTLEVIYRRRGALLPLLSSLLSSLSTTLGVTSPLSTKQSFRLIRGSRALYVPGGTLPPRRGNVKTSDPIPVDHPRIGLLTYFHILFRVVFVSPLLLITHLTTHLLISATRYRFLWICLLCF